MNPLVVIPARGGSKGVPNKNIKLFGGKPLIHYTINSALKLFSKEKIIVSTDSNEILKCAELCGITVPFLRPKHLATDTASTYDVILHAIDYAQSQEIRFDSIVLLQPTSPFRKATHIKDAINLFSSDIDMVVSVKVSKENPYFSLFEQSSNGFLQKSKNSEYTRRQDCPDVYSYNGAIYVINPDSLNQTPIHKFKKVLKYVMNDLDSIDLDTELDWMIGELILES